jgi:hypothetical protein
LLSATLLESFDLTLGSYKEAIDHIPESEWKKGEIAYLVPSRLIYHAVETGDYYTEAEDKFEWGYRFGVEYWRAKPEELPSKSQLMEYHIEVKTKIMEWIGSMSDEELLSKEKVFTWTGSTVLGRALYLLSHYRQHLGEINAELRHRGLDRIKWRTLPG